MTELTCIVCPVGCRIRIERAGEELKISGNGCRRGMEYAHDEMTAPKRMLTAVVQVAGGERMLSVKTKTAIPKAQIGSAMEEIKKISVQLPVAMGQIIKANLAGTGIPLVATKEMAGPIGVDKMVGDGSCFSLMS